MAGRSPSTPVKVPSSAATYTPATLDADLRSQINALLLRDGHVTKIQDHLLHSLHAHPSNWPTVIQTHALGLLRSGEVTTFPALVRRILDDVRHDMAQASADGGGGTRAAANGTAAAAADAAGLNGDAKKATNGNGNENGNGVTADEGVLGQQQQQTPNLALPQAVIEDALRVTRECLEAVCEIDESGGAT